jgi:peptide/nickel transport system substrate-binding protein
MVRILRLRRVFAASLACVLVAAGCSRAAAPPPPATDDASPIRGGSLVVSMRSDPPTYNRLARDGGRSATELVTFLTQARLVRVNRVTGELEPWLAEQWEQDASGLRYTLHLRKGLAFSDGAPFSADDVLFSFAAAYAPDASGIGETLTVEGKPLTVTAADPYTVVVVFPTTSGPGLRLLDNLPILPAHKLKAALAAGKLSEEWTPARPPTDVVGLGPFVLREHVAGQRLVFERNPHYFRQDERGTRLPYLDRLTVLIVKDQAAESLKLQAGETDLMSSANLPPHDLASFKALAGRGALRTIELGVAMDADMLWFNLTGQAPADAPFREREFRQAVSAALDRQAIADTVYLGAAAPMAGPTSPGNTAWVARDLPPPHDVARARALLDGLGYRDRDGDGILETNRGKKVGFSLLAHSDHLRSRVAAMIQEQLRQVGIEVSIVGLDPTGLVGRIGAGDYDAAYFGFESSSPDPALSQDFWLSRGRMHVWHPAQKSPATAWEARMDGLMHVVATSADQAERQRAFATVQQIMVEEAPAIFLVAPRVVAAVSRRVGATTPAVQSPQLLWSADTLSVAPGVVE